MRIKVKVKPGSKKEEVRKVNEGFFEVKIKEPPVEGKANKKLVEILGEYFGIPMGRIRIVAGHRGRVKVVEVGEGDT